MIAPEHVVLSRTDSIGDVVLTLPLAGLLKAKFPEVRITFIGRHYTRPVLKHCTHVDQVLTLEELEAGDAVQLLRDLRADALVHVFPHREIARWAKAAGIPVRIGTSHRLWHWSTCTDRPAFSRKRSDLHESQLNVKLLGPLGITAEPALVQLLDAMGLHPPEPDQLVAALLRHDRIRVILHPGSQGSSVEWGLPRFRELIDKLDPTRYHVYLTGTAAEAEHDRQELPISASHVTNTGGQLDLDQLQMLIGSCHALVAASTGPLHLAGVYGKRAIGLFSPRRPIHPGRWAPLGRDVHVLVHDPECPICAAGKACTCVQQITPERVMALLNGLPRR